MLTSLVVCMLCSRSSISQTSVAQHTNDTLPKLSSRWGSHDRQSQAGMRKQLLVVKLHLCGCCSQQACLMLDVAFKANTCATCAPGLATVPLQSAALTGFRVIGAADHMQSPQNTWAQKDCPGVLIIFRSRMQLAHEKLPAGLSRMQLEAL